MPFPTTGFHGGTRADTSLYTATLNENGAANEGYSMRNVCSSLGSSGSWRQIRVRFVAATSGANFTTTNASVGIRSSNANTTATPTELKFSGVSGFDLAPNTTITSDWTDFNFSSTDSLIVIFDVYAVSGGNLRIVLTGSTDAYAKAATQSYNSSSVTGFSLGSGDTYSIDLVEGR